MNSRVKKISHVPNKCYEIRLPGGYDEVLRLSFSMDIPNLDEAVERFTEAVWKGKEDEKPA